MRLYETESVRLAPQNRSDDDIALLRENIEDLKKCDPDNTQMEVDMINRFHMNLSKATGNPIIMVTMEPVHSLLPRMRSLIYGNIEGEKEYTLRLQQNILHAVEHRDGQKAWQFSVELLNRNMEVYNKYFKN